MEGVSMQGCRLGRLRRPDAAFSESSQREDEKGVKAEVVSRKGASVLGLNPAGDGCWIRLEV